MMWRRPSAEHQPRDVDAHTSRQLQVSIERNCEYPSPNQIFQTLQAYLLSSFHQKKAQGYVHRADLANDSKYRVKRAVAPRCPHPHYFL